MRMCIYTSFVPSLSYPCVVPLSQLRPSLCTLFHLPIFSSSSFCPLSLSLSDLETIIMPVIVVGLLLLLALAGHSDAAYCVCNSGLSDTVLQTNIDYACGNGADCSAILQNGACYNPNTVKDHCNYAVNSYYQRKGQMTGSCDFKGTATVTQNLPSGVGSGCVYQSSPSSGGSTTPSTPNTGGTGGTGGTTTGGGSTTNTGTIPGSTFGPGPIGSGIGNTDSSTGAKLQSYPFRVVVLSLLSLLVSGLMCL